MSTSEAGGAPSTAAGSPTPTTSTRRILRTDESREDSANPSADYLLESIVVGPGIPPLHPAIQTALERRVLVKTATDEAGARELEREANLLAGLEHPGIIPLYEAGRDSAGRVFAALRDVPGVPWAAVLAERDIEEHMDILGRLCDAIAFAHSRGVAHMSLGLESVRLAKDGQVVITDWSTAQAFASDVGSESEEQAQADMAAVAAVAEAPREDIRCIGSMIERILLACTPDHTQDSALAGKDPDGPKGSADGGDRDLVAIAERCRRETVDDGFAAVNQLQAALARWRSRRELRLLIAHALKLADTAEATGAYHDFRAALHAFQAIPSEDRESIADRESETRRAFVERALERGDFRLAEDLCVSDPRLADTAAIARRQGRRQRRWVQLATTFRVGVSVMLVLLVALLLYFYIRWSQAAERSQTALVASERALQAADRASERAQAAAERARAEALASTLRSSLALLEQEQPSIAMANLERIADQSDTWIWRYLYARAWLAQWVIEQPTMDRWCTAWHPDGRTLVCGHGERTLAILDVDRRHLRQLPIPEQGERVYPHLVTFDPSGQYVLAAFDRVLWQVDPESGATEAIWEVPPRHHVLAGMRDGSFLVLHVCRHTGADAKDESERERQFWTYDLESGTVISRSAAFEGVEAWDCGDGRIAIVGENAVLHGPVDALETLDSREYRRHGKAAACSISDDRLHAIYGYPNGGYREVDLLDTDRSRPVYFEYGPQGGDFTDDGRRYALTTYTSDRVHVRTMFSAQDARVVVPVSWAVRVDWAPDGNNLAIAGPDYLQVVSFADAPSGFLALDAESETSFTIPGVQTTLRLQRRADEWVIDDGGKSRGVAWHDRWRDGPLVYLPEDGGVRVEVAGIDSIVGTLGTGGPAREMAVISEWGLILTRHPQGIGWLLAPDIGAESAVRSDP